MSCEVPEGWRSGSISDLVAEVTQRIDPQAVSNPDIPYLGLEDIGQGTGTILSVGQARDATSQKSCFAPGDILFGKLRPNLKKVAHPDFEGICSTDISVFRAKSQVDPEFAFRVLSSDPLIEHAVAHSAGTKMPRAHARSILAFEAMLPPPDEQRRIAEVLRSVDEVIARLQCTLDAYRRLRSAEVETFARASFDGDARPLERLIAVMDSGWSPDCDGQPAKGQEWGVLKTSAVTWEGFDDRHNKRLPTELIPRPLLAVARDDILITRAGPAERTGVVAIVRATDGKRMLSDKLIRIRAREDQIEPLALAEVLRSEPVQDQLRALKSGMAASQTNISQKALRGVLIPVVPREVQLAFVDRMNSLDAALDAERKALSTMRSVKQSIGSDLLSGRIRVPA